MALLVCLLLAVVGLWDDVSTLPPLPRLAAQIALGGVAGWSTGVPAMAIAGLLLFPVVVNAANFMDGINGISGLVFVVWGLTAGYMGHVYGASHLSLLGLVSAGAALGFLPYNAMRARLFLGDVGSYLFGGLGASGLLIGAVAGVPLTPLVAPLALYLVDVFATMLKRLMAGKSLTTAHRDHVYQRLANVARISHVQVSIGVAVTSLMLAALSLLLPFALWLLAATLVSAAYLASPGFVDSRAPREAVDAT
ncbi:hypothetical protein [Terrabacter terrae]|uniref:hypothetical protein n=1 Tax=Terrabacter terrae TaxID=318434 RepID=UPI0031E1C937